jgi:hypothetical protein
MRVSKLSTVHIIRNLDEKSIIAKYTHTHVNIYIYIHTYIYIHIYIFGDFLQ